LIGFWHVNVAGWAFPAWNRQENRLCHTQHPLSSYP